MMRKIILALTLAFISITFCSAEDIRVTEKIEISSLDNSLPNLELYAPEGWKCTLGTDMEDFKVYYIKNEASTAQIGIYIGFQPNLFNKRLENIMVAEEPDVIGDKKISWYVWEEDKSGQKEYHRETILSGLYSKTKVGESNFSEHLLLHIFITAKKKLDMEEAVNIMQMLRVKN